jgi:hypothetical protein
VGGDLSIARQARAGDHAPGVDAVHRTTSPGGGRRLQTLVSGRSAGYRYPCCSAPTVGKEWGGLGARFLDHTIAYKCWARAARRRRSPSTCMRRRNSSLISRSFARVWSRRDFLRRRNLPLRVVPQMSTKPRYALNAGGQGARLGVR